MKSTRLLNYLFLCVSSTIGASCAYANLVDLAPPKIILTDEFGVNMLNGQVTHSLNTVSIGGAMGLSHSISSYSNNFSMTANRGYQDKYYCKGRGLMVKTDVGASISAVRLNDLEGSIDFIALVNGQRIGISDPVSYGTYTYQALGDIRNTLERKSDGYVYWTKPDGTVVKYEGGTNSYPDSVGMMTQIQYPNGFIIYNDWISSKVTTNTGFGLKYIFQYNPADATMNKQDVSSTAQIPQVNAQSWANMNPKYIQAINLAKENCMSQTCSGTWPKAEFIWPAGMPRTMYIGTSQFEVIDAAGGHTLYRFQSFDLAYDKYNQLIQGQTSGREYSPRLMSIKPAYSTTDFFTYTYDTRVNMSGTESTYVSSVQKSGVTVSAKKGDLTTYYSMDTQYQYTNANRGDGKVTLVIPSTDRPGTIGYAETNEGKLFYEAGWRNFLTTYDHFGVREDYEYAPVGRGNLTKVSKNGSFATAIYPPSCDSTNFKYCNKPSSTTDAKGNTTSYTYHVPSGQIETITSPADKNGRIPQVRYGYTQKSASYYSGTNKILGSPIWLKTSESTCATTSPMGNGCTGGAVDEIITRYEYEHDNLLLTGTTVTAADTSGALVTKRTCFQYDQYGNRIGQTQPKANPSSCPQI